MNPSLAALLTIAGILFLLWHDSTRGEPGSAARWLPVAWLGITGSRFVSQWLSLGSPHGGNYTEGSPIDAAYFASLMVMSAVVLARRGVRIGEVARLNKWLFALALLGLMSTLWADVPDLAFKRWVKTLGHPLVALVILTDRDPVGALRAVFKRCAYILLPLSVLFIKYWPEYGRGFDQWTGQGFNHGVGHAKNDLAMLSMVFALFFSWNILSVARIAERAARRREIAVSAVFLWMCVWLLDSSDGAGALATLVMGLTVMVVVAWRIVPKRHFGSTVVVLALVIVTLEINFNIYADVITLLGRKPNLTDRTEVWSDVLRMQDRPWFGFGFESFWLGSRLDALWAKWWWQPIQAHNGYIETYLNQGLVGVGLLAGLLLSTFARISAQLLTDFQLARLRLALLVAVLMFNWTEAGFKGVAFMWTIFHIVAMEYRRPERAAELVPRTA